MTYDVVIIGAGPGGYVAAIRAGQLGLKVAVVEHEKLGGICLNWGCIPTKALLRAAEVYHTVQNAADFGIEVKGVSINFKKLIQRSRDVAEKLASGVQFLLQKNKVDVIQGHGKLVGNRTVQVSDKDGKSRTLTAKHIIIATGGRPRPIPDVPLNSKYLWSYKEAMMPDALPSSLLIVGSGAIGMEFASFYNSLGTKVTVVELQERILQSEDVEIAAAAHKAFEKRGINIITDTTIKGATVGKGVDVILESKGKTTKIQVERIIAAIGIMPNIEDIGLENTKIQLERGFIKTDEYLATAEPGIYAIGDVTAPPWLAHKASEEAVICIERIAGLKPQPIVRQNIPACTYCYPQIASIGLSEVEASKLGAVKVGRFPLQANGKAIAMGDTEGFVKVIFDAKTSELLGAHMIGPEVTEMIQGFAIAKQLEGTALDLISTIFPHPTISEAMREAVLDADNHALHI